MAGGSVLSDAAAARWRNADWPDCFRLAQPQPLCRAATQWAANSSGWGGFARLDQQRLLTVEQLLTAAARGINFGL